jgi:MtN3 and saliva related transmembrane protein
MKSPVVLWTAADWDWKTKTMSTFVTVIGLAAAVCTTAANLPQLKKAWTTGETDDLSLKALLLLGSGLTLWVAYGLLREDIIIILANGVSLALLAAILYLKLAQAHPQVRSRTGYQKMNKQ